MLDELQPDRRPQVQGEQPPEVRAGTPATGLTGSLFRTDVARPSALATPAALPKGGGAIRGIDEKLGVQQATGAAGLTVSLGLSPGRGGFGPGLTLGYDSGAGNGSCGVGWTCSPGSIRRGTDRGVPRYRDESDTDVFQLSGFEDLVPALVDDGAGGLTRDLLEVAEGGATYLVERYRPRIEGAFARIERWRERATGETHWRTHSRTNSTSLFGRTAGARVADHADATRVFEWLLEEERDDRGNVVAYEYKAEDAAGVDAGAAQERNRAGNPYAQRYLKRIQYGNEVAGVAGNWLFEAVLDYGEHDAAAPTPAEVNPWPLRQEPFSSYRPGFELRTQRLCRRILMFHRFAELGAGATLVRATELGYDERPTLTRLTSVTQRGYIRGAGGYSSKALPPLELEYEDVALDESLKTLDPASLENLPAGLDGSSYRFLDLDGEGLAGFFSEEGGGWFYKRNLGGGTFGPAETVPSLPSTAATTEQARPGALRPQLFDVNGDGQLELVSLADPAGFFAREADASFAPFAAFASLPKLDFADPQLRLLDLDGDGLVDLLLSQDDAFLVHEGLGGEGFAEAQVAPKERDEERGPALLFADPTESIFAADMSGDGLPDLVRVRCAEVAYWPCLGHGRFGAKVTMGAAPLLDHPEAFDPRRLRLADIDGTGPSDLVYVRADGTTLIVLNQAGNTWAPAQTVSALPRTDDVAALDVVDLFGQGTACLVWSSPLPGEQGTQLRYVDLMGGRKPHLLRRMRNNLGRETTLTYAPSTTFYLADKAAGTPWVSRLPFPVHVVERVETVDHVTGARTVSSYQYRHGFFDPVEREWRGFGCTIKTDTEQFEDYALSGASNVVERDLYQPPVVTKSWFHTGALPDQPGSPDLYAHEFYSNATLPETELSPAGIDAACDTQEWREALRALKGASIRHEIYAQDGTPLAGEPYGVSAQSYNVRRLQPRGPNRHAVFLVVGAESLGYGYEREPSDPRVLHSFLLDSNELGQPTRTASVVYGRAKVDATLPAPVRAAQAEIHVSLTETDYTIDVDTPGALQLRLPCEQRSYELLGAKPSGSVFTKTELEAKIAAAAALELEQAPSGGLDKRLVGRARTFFLKNDLSGPLAIGQLQSLALVSHTHALALTDSLAADVYGGLVDAALLTQAGYVNSVGDPGWWTPSGTLLYPANPAQHFYQPTGSKDAFGNEAHIVLDGYDLLLTSATDAVLNTTTATLDYRVLAPVQLEDANQNRAAVALDELGHVSAFAEMGKAGAGEGDTLGDPTVRYAVELDRFQTQGKPVRSHSFAREQHGAGNPRWQESYSYCDGSGAVVLTKVQAEPGIAKHVAADGTVTEVDTSPALRWIGNGRVVRNNKLAPVKQYEPYFSDSPEYDNAPALVELGVTPILTYDPLGRLQRTDYPDGTLAHIEYGAWRQRVFDRNDAVLDSNWYAQHGSPNPAGPEPSDPIVRAAWLTAKHANTPAVIHLDSRGQTAYGVQDNGIAGTFGARTAVDLGGSRVRTYDQRDRLVLETRSTYAGAVVYERSMERGERPVLADIMGGLCRAWDGTRVFRESYDAGRRPVSSYLKDGAAAEIVLHHQLYGEVHPNAVALNLRGRAHKVLDPAGLVTFERFDFQDDLVLVARRFAREYKQAVDWSAAEAAATPAALDATVAGLVEAEVFTSSFAYDALHRPISIVSPDASELVPRFNERNRLASLQVAIRGGAPTTFVNAQSWDAKGQVLSTSWGNTSESTFTYDLQTFRLLRQLTTRNGDGAVLQDLAYTQDPVGNLTRVADAAQQTLFYANAVVAPTWLYQVDALYQLVRASGRESASGQPTETDLPRGPLPGDASAVRTYTEQFDYDELGNLKRLRHTAAGGSWTRFYAYDPATNRLTSTSLPGDPAGGPYSATYSHDAHGNMTHMPHLATLAWNATDQLKQVDLGGGGTVYYVYGEGGQRIRKVIERLGPLVEEHIYLGSVEITRSRTGAGLVLERETLHVTDSGRRLAQVDTKTIDTNDPTDLNVPLVRYQLGNNVGSATLELDATGAVVTYEEYHPFGSSSYRAGRSAAETSLKRYRYLGKEHDDDTSLYACGARWYAAWLGRWTSSDPGGFVDGPNLYRYAHNNPVTLSDPNGRDPKDKKHKVYHHGPKGLADPSKRAEAEKYARSKGYTIIGWNQEEHLWNLESIPPQEPRKPTEPKQPGPDAPGPAPPADVVKPSAAPPDDATSAQTAGQGVVTTYNAAQRGGYENTIKETSADAVKKIVALKNSQQPGDAAKAWENSKAASDARIDARALAREKMTPSARSLSEAVDNSQHFDDYAKKYATPPETRPSVGKGNPPRPPDPQTADAYTLAEDIAEASGRSRGGIGGFFLRSGKWAGPIGIAVGLFLGGKAIWDAPPGERGRVAAREGAAFAGGLVGVELGATAGVAIAAGISSFLIALGVASGPIGWLAIGLGILGGMIGAWLFGKLFAGFGTSIYD